MDTDRNERSFVEVPDSQIEDVIRETPGPITECWIVVAEDDPDTVLFVAAGPDQSHNSRTADEKLRELISTQFGRRFNCYRATMKAAIGVFRMPRRGSHPKNPATKRRRILRQAAERGHGEEFSFVRAALGFGNLHPATDGNTEGNE
jgi:hypothetical protein